MLRDLLLPLTGTAGDPDALSFAIDLAAAHRAHLTVAVPLDLPLPLVTPWGLTPEAMMVEQFPLPAGGCRSACGLGARTPGPGGRGVGRAGG